jgi:ribosomal protein S18 acetylase RimI-like enzyme
MVSTGEPVLDMNCAAVYSEPHAVEALREYQAALSSRACPFMICLSDEIAATLAPVAQSLGMRRGGPVSVMELRSRSLASCPFPAGLILREAENQLDLNAAAALASATFGIPLDSVRKTFSAGLLVRPGVNLYLATLQTEVAALAILTQQDVTAGIWCMCTAPNLRRRGIGSALLSHAIQDQRSRGTQTLFLLPTPDGRPLYERFGFQTATTGQAWINP